MGVNKVVFGNETIVNLTDADVKKSQILSGAKAYDQNGDLLDGDCTYDADTSDANATDDDILLDKTAYVGGKKKIGKMPNIGTQKIEVSDVNTPVAINKGYHDGGGYAIISENEKSKLVGNNIRKDVTILGVLGTMTGEEDVTAIPKTIKPKVTEQTFVPSAEGADYFSDITVEAITKTVTETGNGTTGTTVTIGQV